LAGGIKDRQKELQPVVVLAGTEWSKSGGYIEFRKDGSGRTAASRGTAARAMNWKLDGNTVTITWTDGDMVRGTVENDELRIGADIFKKR
jgi:hypothetical protein